MSQRFRSQDWRPKQGLTPWNSVVAVVFIVSCIALQASAQEFEFRFNPPDSVASMKTVKTTRVKDLDSLGRQTDVIEGEEKVIIKKTPTGYSVYQTPISATMSRDGKQVDSPILTLLLGITATFELDTAGQLLAIRGFEEVTKKMRESYSPEVVNSLASVLNEEAMINKEAAEWNARIGLFIGRTARLGDVWTSTEEVVLPTGDAMVYHTATKFAEKVKCNTHDCIRIQFWYNSDAGALQDAVGKVLNDITDSAGTPHPKVEISGAEVVGEGERIIDPATMLIYHETISRTMKMQMDITGEGKTTVTMQETRETGFDYNK